MNSEIRELKAVLEKTYQEIMGVATVSVSEKSLTNYSFAVDMRAEEEDFNLDRVHYGLILDMIAFLLYLYKLESDCDERVLYDDVAAYLEINESERDKFYEKLVAFLYNEKKYIEEGTIFMNIMMSVDEVVRKIQESDASDTTLSESYYTFFFHLAKDFAYEMGIHTDRVWNAIVKHVEFWFTNVNEKLLDGKGTLELFDHRKDSVELNITDYTGKRIPVDALYEMWKQVTKDAGDDPEKKEKAAYQLFDEKIQFTQLTVTDVLRYIRYIHSRCTKTVKSYEYIDYPLRHMLLKTTWLCQISNLSLSGDSDRAEEDYNNMIEMQLEAYFCKRNPAQMERLYEFLPLEEETIRRKNRMHALSCGYMLSPDM